MSDGSLDSGRACRCARLVPNKDILDVRARILVPLAALAMLAGACSSVPADSVATVNGQAVDYDRFERIVSAQAVNLGLPPRDAEVAQRVIEAGIVDRAALDQVLISEIEKLDRGEESAIAAGPPLEVPQEFVDQLYQQQVGSREDLDTALSDVGLSSRRFREVFDRLVRFEARGLQVNRGPDGSFQTGFPIDRSQQLADLQQAIIQQLVQAEIARQAVEELELEVSDETVTQIEDQIAGQFEDDAALRAALEDFGFTEEDFRELIVRTRARQQAIQQVEDPAQAQAFFENLDVRVAGRFGRWDEQQGTVVPPADDL